MAKNSATEAQLGTMHSALTKVFQRSLERQLRIYEALDKIPEGEIEAEMLEILTEISEPNPAMLSAMSKFLKDNDIGFAKEEVDELTATERRLKEQREKRTRNGFTLHTIPKVDVA